MNAEYLTVYEVAEKFNVKHWAVREAIRKGRLKAVKSFSCIRIHRDELDRYVLENRVGPRTTTRSFKSVRLASRNGAEQGSLRTRAARRQQVA